MADDINFSVTALVDTVFRGDMRPLLQDVDKSLNKFKKQFSQQGKEAIDGLLKEFDRPGGARGVAGFEKLLKGITAVVSKEFSGNALDEVQATVEAMAREFASLGGADLTDKISASFRGGFNIKDDIGDAADGFDKMDSAAERLTKAFKELTANLSGFFDLTEKSLKELIRLEAKYVSESIVGSQGKMAQDKREAEARHDAIMQAEREESRRFQLLKITEQRITVEKNEGQKRQTAELKASLKEQSLATNAYFQQQTIREKESLDRRQAMQRFFFDSLRSTFKTGVGAVDAIWRGMYTSIQAIAKRGEGGLFNLTLNSSKQRNKIFESEQRERQSAMQRFSQKGEGGVLGAVAGTSMAGGQLRNIAAAAGSVFGLGKIFTLGSEFQEQLNVTAALTGATKKEFEDLRKAAIGLGNDITLPGVSAGQAAEAMGNLARSGFSVADSISAAKGVLSLARGAQLDFGVASTIVGKSLNVFGIEAAKATQVSDAFTGALALAPQTINDIQAAVARGGGAFISSQKYADTAKNNMEKFLATTSSLIKLTGRSGEEVGTGLKRFFEVFQNPSKPAQLAINQLSKAAGISKGAGNIMYDAAGKTRKFEEQIFYLKKGVGALGSEQEKAAVVGQIFGSEASGIALALASEAFNLDMTVGQLRRLGDSSKIAAARNEGLKGALDALTSQFETFAILAYEKVNKPLGNIVVAIATVIDKIANGGGAFKMLRQGLMGAAAGLAVIAAAKGAREALTYLRIAMSALMSPMGLMIVAAAAIGAGFTLLYKSSKPFREIIEVIKFTIIDFVITAKNALLPIFSTIGNTILDLIDTALSLVGPIFKDILKIATDVWATVANLVGAAGLIITTAIDMIVSSFKGDKVGGVFGAIGKFARGAFDALRNGLKTIAAFARTVAESIMGAFKAEGIIGVVKLPFVKLKEIITGFFKNIDFGKLILSALLGIRTAFAAIGRRIGLIVGSTEFRNAILIAFGSIGGILGLAALGLVEGLIDGLRKSELGKKVIQAVKNLLNPIEFIKALFGALTGNPSSIVGMILRGGLLIALGLLVKKIKDVFEKGSTGLKIAFKFASGDQVGANKLLEETKKKTIAIEKANIKLKQSADMAFGGGVLSKIVVFGDKIRELTKPVKAFSDAIGSIAATRGVNKLQAFAEITKQTFKPLTAVFSSVKDNAGTAMISVVQSVQNGLIRAGISIRDFAIRYGEMRSNRKVDAGAVVRQNLADFAASVKLVAQHTATELRWFRSDTSKKFDDLTATVRQKTALLVMAFSGTTVGKKVIEFGKNVVTNLKQSSADMGRQIVDMASTLSEKFKSFNTKIEKSLADNKESKFKKAFDKTITGLKSGLEQFKFDVGYTIDSAAAKLAPIGERISTALINGLGKAQAFKAKVTEWVTKTKTELSTAISNGFGKDLLGNLPELGGLGLASGGGLAALIVGESPQAKFAGLTSAIFGVTQSISVAKAMAMEFGAVAGFATGGLMLAFSAAAFAVGIFASQQRKAKKAAEETQERLRSFRSELTDLTDKFGYSGRTFSLEFAKKIADSEDTTFKQFRSSLKDSGFLMRDLTTAMAGGSKGITAFKKRIETDAADIKLQIQAVTQQISDLQTAARAGDQSPAMMKQIEDARSAKAAFQGRLDRLNALKKLLGETNSQLQMEAEKTALIASLNADVEVEQRKGKTALTNNKEATDKWKSATDELRNAIVSSIDALTGRDPQKALDDAATASFSLTEALKSGKVTTDELFNGTLTPGAIEGRKQLDTVREGVAGIISAQIAQGGTQAEINAGLDAQKRKLIDGIVAQGGNRQQAELLVGTLIDGFKNADATAAGFMAATRENLNVLASRAGGLRSKFETIFSGMDVTSDMRKDLDAFITKPDEKTIKALLEDGVAIEDLQAFVDNPTEKTIKALFAKEPAFDKKEKAAAHGRSKPFTGTFNKDKAFDPRTMVAAAPKNKRFAGVFGKDGGFDGKVLSAASTVDKKVNLKIANESSFGEKVTGIIGGITRSINVVIRALTGNNANGSVVKSPLLTWVGEGNKPEVIIPLTKPKRAVELFKQSGLESVLAAGGYGRQAAGPNVSSVVNDKTSNVTVNQTFNVNGDTNLRKASRRASNSGYDLGRQLRGL